MKLRAHEQSPGDSEVHIVMELCEGSELFDRIVARGLYTERAACRMTLEAVQAFGRGEVLTDLDVKANDLQESAFLNYIYENIKNEEFLTHSLELLRAPDKYDACDLKEACHESLLQDIETPQLKTSTGIWKTKQERLETVLNTSDIEDTGFTEESSIRPSGLL